VGVGELLLRHSEARETLNVEVNEGASRGGLSRVSEGKEVRMRWFDKLLIVLFAGAVWIDIFWWMRR
jgi:hypothetical protein